jgi:hemerythrin
MKWDGSLALGHPILDEDHQELAAAINGVAQTLARPGAAGAEREWRATALTAFDALRQRAEAHFRSEEWVMDNASYPGLAAHRLQHRKLIAELENFVAAHLAPGAEGNAAAMVFLREWLALHIRIWDASLVRWLGRRDVSA